MTRMKTVKARNFYNFGGGASRSKRSRLTRHIGFWKNFNDGFTLAEMMVVLLIMSIVLACLAPAMTTKMKADQNIQTSPWKWVQQGGGRNLDAYFGNGNLQMAHIGQTQRAAADNAKLVINNSDFDNLLLFKSGNNVLGHLRINSEGLNLGTENIQAITIGHNVDGGFGSVAIGSNIMTHVDQHNAPSGHYNVALGVNALSSNTFGHRNEAIGWSALSSNTTGIENIGVGVSSLLSNTTGSSNTVLGTRAGSGNTTGSNNVIIGHEANNNAVSDKSNIVVIGSGASGSANNAIAIGAGVTGEGENSVAIGSNATAGTETTSLSYGNAIAIGNNARALGEDNIAIGRNALFTTSTSNSVGAGNVAIGAEAMYYHYSINVGNTAVGYKAMKGSSRSSNYLNTAIGYEALTSAGTTSSSAGHDTAVGYQSLYSNTTGFGNTAVGVYALKNNVSGSYNTAIGKGACQYVTGSHKTCIGYGSGPSSLDSLAKKNNNDKVIFLGDASTTVYIPGNIVVGKDTILGADSANKGNGNPYRVYLKGGNKWYTDTWVYLGTDDYKGDDDNFYRVNPITVGSFTLGSGDAFDDAADHDTPVNTSDRRLKYVGKENSDGLAKLRQLKIFNYTFKKDEKKTPHVGVMAQDLQKVFPNAVKKGADGFLTIRMEDMFYAVINAIKELDARVTALEKENKMLKEQNKALDARLKALEAKIK